MLIKSFPFNQLEYEFNYAVSDMAKKLNMSTDDMIKALLKLLVNDYDENDADILVYEGDLLVVAEALENKMLLYFPRIKQYKKNEIRRIERLRSLVFLRIFRSYKSDSYTYTKKVSNNTIAKLEIEVRKYFDEVENEIKGENY